MIRYALHCDRSHEFEGWFGSSADFDNQNGRGLVECPVCQSKKIGKSLMTPSVSTSRRREARVDPAAPAPDKTPEIATAGLSAGKREMLAQMRQLRERILADAEDVGERFPEEARRIHYGERQARGIYGKASPQEAAGLAEEGIEFLPLPDLPDDQN